MEFSIYEFAMISIMCNNFLKKAHERKKCIGDHPEQIGTLAAATALLVRKIHSVDGLKVKHLADVVGVPLPILLKGEKAVLKRLDFNMNFRDEDFERTVALLQDPHALEDHDTFYARVKDVFELK
jgi:hypothetical protein